jgi:hypothetical protein
MLNIYNYHTHPETLIKATHIVEQDGGLYVGNFYGDGIILSKKSMERKLSWHDAMKYCDDLGDMWEMPQVNIMSYIIERKNQFMHFPEYVLDSPDYWTNRESADYAMVIELNLRKFLTPTDGKYIVRPVKKL